MTQGSILGLLLFLVYLNDLSKNLSSTAKHFADGTSIYSVVHDISLTSLQLNDDTSMIMSMSMENGHDGHVHDGHIYDGHVNGKCYSILT